MWKYTIAVGILISTATVYAAQYGTAENGYYPEGYYGQTFTGEVTSTNDETREVTLSFTNSKNGKAQLFIGVLEEGYSIKLKDGNLHEVKPSGMRPGGVIKVYYMPTTKKVGGQKTKINVIFLIEGYPNARERFAHFKALH
jgi:hypothetical protein